jgi:hypothetical protein
MAWDLDAWLEQAYAGELLPEPAIRLLCLKTAELLEQESNVRHVAAPVVVVGWVVRGSLGGGHLPILCA